MKRQISRRKFLRGAGGVAIALPFLEILNMDKVFGQSASAKRFIVLWSPNGTPVEFNFNNQTQYPWKPTRGTGTSFTIPQDSAHILYPLRDKASDLFIFGGKTTPRSQNYGDLNVFGISAFRGYHQNGDGHGPNISFVMTGTELDPTYRQNANNGHPQGPSIDQAIATYIKAQNPGLPYKSYHFGVQPSPGFSSDTDRAGAISWRDATTANPSKYNPQEIFNQAIANITPTPIGTPTPTPTPNPATSRKASVLDAVMEDLKSFKTKVGTSDGQRLDAHLTSVREIEQRLQVIAGGGGGGGGTCQRPTLSIPAASGNVHDFWHQEAQVNGQYLHPVISRLHIDMMVAMLACDLTRVATLQWSRIGSVTKHYALGIDTEHHGLTHNSGITAEYALASQKKIDQWYISEMNYLIDRLKFFGVFDNTVILKVNEMSHSGGHWNGPYPVILAGANGKPFRTGQFLDDFPAEIGINKLHVALLNAFGVPNSGTFGDSIFNIGTLPSLT